MIVAPVTVYGATSVTLSGSKLATQSVSPATLRLALLGKVMTVGDTVSLLPRDLGPGTSTSAATSALASSVGITWTSELLTVTGVDPTGPVSVQPNSLVTWGDGADLTAQSTHGPAHGHRAEPDAGQPAHPRRRSQGRARPGRPADRVAQARARRTEAPRNPRRQAQSRCAGVRARRRRQGHPGARGVRAAAAGRVRRPRGRRAARRGPAGAGVVGGRDGPRRRRRAAHHRRRRAAARRPPNPSPR